MHYLPLLFQTQFYFFTWFSSDDKDEVTDSEKDSESDGMTSSVEDELAVLSEKLRVFLRFSEEYPLLLSPGPPSSLKQCDEELWSLLVGWPSFLAVPPSGPLGRLTTLYKEVVQEMWHWSFLLVKVVFNF